MSSWLVSGDWAWDRATPLLATAVLLWSRCAPLFLLAPWLALRVRPSPLLAALSLGGAAALMPLALAAGPAANTLGPTLILACGCELVRGSVLALGCALPLSVFESTGAVADALRGGVPTVAGEPGPLATLYGRAALLCSLVASAHLGLLRLLADALEQMPLGVLLTDHDQARSVLLALGQLVVRAFALGLALSTPVLVGSFVIALVFGWLARLAAPLLVPAAGGLWAWLSLAVVCLSVASVLDQVPGVVRLFTGETARLLRVLR